MNTFQDFLNSRVEIGPLPTEDVLASFLPLLEQVIETHVNGKCAPLQGLSLLNVDGVKIWYENSHRINPVNKSMKVRKLDRRHKGAIEVIHEEKRVTSVDSSYEGTKNLHIASLDEDITRPVYLPKYIAWEHIIGHHDPLVDVFSLGMILASLACGLNFDNPDELARFVYSRGNLFSLNPKLHPVLAKAIFCMTELSRHHRPQDLKAVLRNLEHYKEQDVDLEYELAQIADFGQKDSLGKQQVILAKLQERLFEISHRNRLLHFKQTMHSLNLTYASVPLSLDICNIRPDQILTWDSDFKSDAINGNTISLNKYLDFKEVLYLPGVLDRIRLESSRDYAEFGFEQTRLAICFLRWANLKESPPELYNSPFVLLPVKLQKKKGVCDTYWLQPLSNEAEINPVLRHLFKQLYDIDLPEKLELKDDCLDKLYEYLTSKIEASEPGITVNKIDRPRIDLIHDKARRRLDRYCRGTQLSGLGVRKYLDIDYSYDLRNFHPLGLQLFNAMVRPVSTHLKEIIQERPGPRSHFKPDTESPVSEKEKQFYTLKSKDDNNPYVWEFDLCSLTLSNFRYRKMTLVRDYTELLKNKKDNSAFEDIFSLAPRPVKLESDIVSTLNERFHVVPCDPTQTEAVQLAQTEKSYIIQGPPGTGKSQTITNLIVDYIIRDKRVLFVCEKRAAIDVVYHRLEQLGLDNLCCLIHDSQADKKEFVMDLKHTYETFLGKQEDVNYQSIRKRLIKAMLTELKTLEDYNTSILTPTDKSGVPLRNLLERAIELSDVCPDLSLIEQERLPHYHVWANNSKQIKSLTEIICSFQKDGVFAHYPLRWLHANIERAERPLELITTNLTDASNIIVNFLNTFENLNIPDDCIDNLDKISTLLKYGKLISYLAQRELAGILVPNSGISKDFASHIGEYEKKILELKKYQEATQNWRNKLPSDETAIALEQARAFENKFFAFLNPQWWQLRKVLRKSYDFSKHAVKPSWSHILSALQQEHKAKEFVIETAKCIQDKLHIQDDIEELIEMISSINDFISKLPPEIKRLHLEIITSKDIDRIAMRLDHLNEDFERLRCSLDKCLIDISSCPTTILQKDITAILDRLDDLPEYLTCMKELSGLPEDFCNALRHMPYTTNQIEAAMARRDLNEIFRSDRSVNRFTSETQRRCIKRLETFYQHWLELNAKVIYEKVRRRFLEDIRISSLPASELTQEQKEFKRLYNRGRREVEHEFSKSMRFKSVRDLVTGESGMVIDVLKPVWLMSPLSVSDALPLDTSNFDVVIFDEASQITLEEAIPSIFRAKQAIVVGDEMQLPPTNFFSAKRVDDDEELQIEEGGDIFEYDLASNSFLNHAAKNLSSKLLGWHYRSRSESLISFSNWAFYQGRLLTVPEEQCADIIHDEIIAESAEEARDNTKHLLERPISFHYMKNGIYLKRRNRMEADYIANLVYDLLMNDIKLSIGIVAFSEAQQDEIESAMERLSKKDRKFRDRLEAETEREENGQFMGLLVKNLENIQGDERDIIILSVCYGYDPDGKMLMNFGPINQSGGEKRLNVAFSRSKHHMVLVSSIRHTDIKNDYNDGANCLKNYLQYAASCSTGDSETTQRVLRDMAVWKDNEILNKTLKESCVVKQIAQSLENKGYKVDLGVGMSHFRCDLAVKSSQSNAYSLGILVDTFTYYSQTDLLERDMMKPKLLRNFGWNIAHVLAKDWYMDSDTVIRNLEERININHEDISHEEILADDLEWIYNGSDGQDEEYFEQSYPLEQAPEVDSKLQNDNKRYFEFISGISSKFWEITLCENEFTVRYGRIGTNGQKTTNSFSSPALAKDAAQKIIQQKITKGYKEKDLKA